MMPGLPSDLYNRCRKTLLKCSEFDNDASLRAVFVTSELRPFRGGLPDAGSKTERVERFLAYVVEKRLSDRRSVYTVFLETLRDRYAEGDGLRDELIALLNDIGRLEDTNATDSKLGSDQRRQEEATTTADPNQPPKVPTPENSNNAGEQHLVILATGFLGFLMGLLGNLLAGWIQKDILQDTFSSTSVMSILLLTIIGLVAGAVLRRFSTSQTKLRRSFYWVFAVILTGIVILVTGLAWRSIVEFPPKPPSVYYIIDATDRMAPLFDEVLKLTQETTVSMADNARVGLRIYGGQLSDRSGCRDTTQLLELNTYEDVSTTLDAVLRPVKPQGNGALTGAVLETLYEDLAEETDVVRLVIITSGVDYRCEIPESGILEGRADEVESVADITIFSIGTLDPRTEAAFENYAKAFGGKHFNRETPADIGPAIETFVDYGSNYLVNYFATPSPVQ
jgi:uncharacterized membrane protein YeaQ/YmgE (transglycosylase-associated protein family)